MKIFESVAQLKLARLGAGQIVKTKGYYTANDGGGAEYIIVASGTGTDDGGSYLDLALNQAQLVTDDTVSVQQFGAKGNNSAFDDAPAINATGAYVANSGWSLSNTDSGGTQFTGARVEMKFATRIYYLGSSLTFSAYDNLDFQYAIFRPHATFTLTDFAFDIVPYNCSWKRLRLANFSNGIRATNANLDGTVVRFEDFQATGMDLVFDIDLRSALVVIDKCKFDKVKRIVYTRACDKMHVKESWCNAGLFDNDWDALFTMDSTVSPSLHLDNFLYVPRPQTALKTAIVNLGSPTNLNPCRVYINGMLAGSEPGRIAIVNSWAKADIGRGTYININNGSSFTANTACVRLMNLPNAVSFTNHSGGIEEAHVESLIVFDEAVQTFATAEAGLIANTTPEFWFNGYTASNFKNLPRTQKDKLAKYVRSHNKKIRDYVKTIGTSPTNIVLPSLVFFDKGNVWKVKATNVENPAADRYTEVIVHGDFAGNLSIVSIVQGTTVAPIFGVSGTTLTIKSSAGTNNFGIEYEQLVTAVENYP